MTILVIAVQYKTTVDVTEKLLNNYSSCDCYQFRML